MKQHDCADKSFHCLCTKANHNQNGQFFANWLFLLGKGNFCSIFTIGRYTHKQKLIAPSVNNEFLLKDAMRNYDDLLIYFRSTDRRLKYF